MWYLKLFGMIVAWTIAMLCVSVISGLLVGDIVMGKSSPVPGANSTKTWIFTASGYAELSPNEWFKLVILLEKQERCLYGPDRSFLREMINILTIDEYAMPNEVQQKWILSLKRECKL